MPRSGRNSAALGTDGCFPDSGIADSTRCIGSCPLRSARSGEGLVTPSTVVSVTRNLHAGIPRRPAYRFSRFRVVRPSVLGCAALAIAVLLRGYGYKLSLYHQHERRSHIRVAKFWIERRAAAGSAASRVSRLVSSLTNWLPFATSPPRSLSSQEKSRWSSTH